MEASYSTQRRSSQQITSLNMVLKKLNTNKSVIHYLIYIKPNVCCLCVSLFVMHSDSFECVCTKFGMWHPYNLRMVMNGRVIERCTPSIRHCKSVADHRHLTSGAQN